MEQIKYLLVFSKFCHRSKHNPVQNNFVTICLVTVSCIKIGSFKDMLFEGGEGAHHCVVQHTLPFMYLCLLPEDGRMDSPKHVVDEENK